LILDLTWGPIAGTIVGLIVGLTGVGGGALMAPILLIGFGMELQTVVATDLLFATITKIAAGGMHIRNQLVDWKIVKRLWLGSITATVMVVIYVQSGHLIHSPTWIMPLLGLLILVSALSLIFEKRLQARQTTWRIAMPAQFKTMQGPMTTVAGGILGALITMTSIGAGALGAVFLRALYPLRMQPAPLVASDTVHAIPVSLIGGLSFLVMGYTDLTMLGFLLLGSIPAALIGSSLVNRVPVRLIKLLLALILSIIGIKLMLL
jgi:uncharacterized protein